MTIEELCALRLPNGMWLMKTPQCQQYATISSAGVVWLRTIHWKAHFINQTASGLYLHILGNPPGGAEH